MFRTESIVVRETTLLGNRHLFVGAIRWNDFQDEHDEVLEQLESFRATFNLSNNNNNNIPRPAVINKDTEAVGRTHLGESDSSSPGLGDASHNISNGEQGNHHQLQLGMQGGDGEQVRNGGGRDDGASATMASTGRPISGRESRSKSSHAPPRPASGRKNVVRTSSSSSYDDGSPGDFGNSSRNQSSGSDVKSLDEGLKPGSSPSPRRPPSVSSSVPSPRYCPSPRPSGSGSGSGSAIAAGGLRRRRSTEECTEKAAAERARGGDDCGGGIISDGEKENQWGQGVDSAESGREITVAEENPCSILHGGDSGGYEDDFDDFVEQESDEGEQQQTAQPQRQDALRDTKEEAFAVRGGSGEKLQRGPCGGAPDDTAYGGAPLVEVVYRPPSGGSKGKVERPKSAARQGRSASLNGAG